MASLMTLTNAHAAEIRGGRWMVICKTADHHNYEPEWKMIGIDAVSGDHLMLTGYMDKVHLLEAISGLDNHAQVFSVRETEPLKSAFQKSASVKSLCDAIRSIYEERSGLSLKQVLNDNQEALYGTIATA